MGILIGVLIGYIIYQEYRAKSLQKDNIQIDINKALYDNNLQELQRSLIEVQNELGEERERSRLMLSQKKSSETRLGQISEHLVGFLEGCPYDPKSMHFLGNPIDFLIFNFDEGEITFLEVKSGNSKPSKRQKTIKNIIKHGRVNYAEMRINEKGIKHKKFENAFEETPMEDTNGKYETED